MDWDNPQLAASTAAVATTPHFDLSPMTAGPSVATHAAATGNQWGAILAGHLDTTYTDKRSVEEEATLPWEQRDNDEPEERSHQRGRGERRRDDREDEEEDGGLPARRGGRHNRSHDDDRPPRRRVVPLDDR